MWHSREVALFRRFPPLFSRRFAWEEKESIRLSLNCLQICICNRMACRAISNWFLSWYLKFSTPAPPERLGSHKAIRKSLYVSLEN